MADIFDWSATPSANTSCDGINCNTGYNPANTDNLFRAIMGAVRNSFASALEGFFAGLSALPIANGGTGATTAAGALTALGALDDDYRDLVRVDKTDNFTFANSERGYAIGFSAASPKTATLNPNATTAINNGATFVIWNTGTASLTVTRGSGVLLYRNGSATSADVVIAPSGVATLVKWFNDGWTITGSGLS